MFGHDGNVMYGPSRKPLRFMFHRAAGGLPVHTNTWIIAKGLEPMC